jgi:peptidoglycan hydrolase-like protein with peptidoglycan-binding domain
MKRSLLAPALFFVTLIIALPVSASGFTFTRDLSVGSSGTDVTYLQVLLQEYHYLNTAPTGYYGAATAAAVAYLQQVNNIPAVGTVGAQTRTLLNAAEASGSVDNSSIAGSAAASVPTNVSAAATPSASVSSNNGSDQPSGPNIAVTSMILRPLGVGSVGGDVTLLQKTLAALGYLDVSATGYFGALTKQAVLEFQAAEGISQVGTVGPITRSAINSIISSGTASVATNTATPSNSPVANNFSGGSSNGGATNYVSPVVAVPDTSDVPETPATTPTISSDTSSQSTANSTPAVVVPTTPPAPAPSQAPVVPAAPAGATNPSALDYTPGSGQFTEIAANCAVPNSSEAHKTFYVDPTNGSDTTGDGSQAKPWKTIQYVLKSQIATNTYVLPYYTTTGTVADNGATKAMSPTGAVHPGDTILLMTGNYGTVDIYGLVNSDFITIAAAPGQTPVLSFLSILGSAKWIIQGLKVQHLAQGYTALVTIETGYYGPVNNIIFDHNSISSQDNVSSWTQADWVANGAWVGLETDGEAHPETNCLTVTNNAISNVRTGTSLGIDNTLFYNNTVNMISEDALDWTAYNNEVISHNTITNDITVGDDNHNDGMQSFTPGGHPKETRSNFVIDGNTIIRRTDPNIPSIFDAAAGGESFQGIDNFGNANTGDMDNLQVTNNVVITDNDQALSFSDVHGGLIANNTVLFDGNQGAGKGGGNSWIDVSDVANVPGTVSTGITVRNNISEMLVINSAGVTADDNVVQNQIQLLDPTTGKTDYFNKAGTYGTNNVLDPNLASGFANFNPLSYQFDVHLNSTSIANGFGVAAQAPATDIAGTPRVAPIAAGAYASSYASTGVTPPVTTPPTPPVTPPTPPTPTPPTSGTPVTTTAGLLAALKTAHAGDTITLAPGTYIGVKIVGLTYGASGLNFTSPVTITSADPSHEAVIEGLGIANVTGLTFRNLAFTSVGVTDPYFAYRIQDSQNLTFDHLYVHGDPSIAPSAQIDGFNVEKSSGLTFTNSDYSYGDPLNFTNDSNVTISGDSFHNLNKGGVEMGGTSDVSITNNVCSDFDSAYGTHVDCIQIFTAGTTVAAHNITITGNLFYRGTGGAVQGIFVQDEVGTLPFSNVTIDDNAMIGGIWSSVLLRGATGNVQVNNNIAATWPGVDVEGSTASNIVTTNFAGWVFLRDPLTGAIITETGNQAQAYPNPTGTGAAITPPGNTVLGSVTDNGIALLKAWLVTHPAELNLLPPDVTSLLGNTTTPVTPPVSPTPPLMPAPNPSPAPSPAPVAPSTFANIAAGCAVPTVSSTRKVWYVDATNGSDTGDGSQAHPWKTLQTVLSTRVSTTDYASGYSGTSVPVGPNKAVNPTGAIHAGDEILLMSGNYGAITVTGDNSDFITIAAAPGQTPVLATLNFAGANKWIAQGLKVQSLSTGADTYKALVTISLNWLGPDNNIILDHNNISSADSTASWTTQASWLANAQNAGISMDDGTSPLMGCLTVTNNTVSNVLTGVSMGVNNSLFEGNNINHFGHDGLDYAASNIVISHNTVENNEILDASHPDGMQGQIGRHTAYSNVVIDGNTVIRQTDPSVQFPGAMQGIDAFDDDWTNMQVTNNLVITNADQALSFASIHGGLIANNTVLFDGSTLAGAGGGGDWVGVSDKTHEGSSTNNVIVRNNISTTLAISTAGATVDHNIAENQIDLLSAAGAETYNSKAGTYGTDNVLAPNLLSGFANFNPTSYQFDVHLNSTSPALGLGNATQAPAVDISGNPRVAPIAAGAYTSNLAPTVAAPIVVPPVVTPPIATTTPPITPVTPPKSPIGPIVTQPILPIASTTPSKPTPIVTLPIAIPVSNGAGETLHMTFDSSTVSGSTVLDESGKGLNGTLVGAPTLVTGKIGDKAIALNGSTQGVSVPASLSQLGVSGNAITVSAWFYNTDTTNPAQTIVASGAVHSSANNETFNILAHDYANKVDASFSDGTHIIVLTPSTNDVSTNTWYNVTSVLNGQTASLYLNGSLVAATTSPTFGTLKDIGRGNLGIGYDAVGVRDYFSGNIDDVQIFNRALSASEISQIANGSLAVAAGTVTTLGSSTGIAPITQTLVAGAAGADVSALQELLKSQGYFTYPVITGDFATITKNAVTAFQKAHDLNPVGLVGPQTRALLNSLAGVGASLGF